MKIILCGKSSCGKDLARDYLINKGFRSIISHTSRPKRDNETDGKDYFFIDGEDFRNRNERNEFLETRTFITKFNNIEETYFYGTSYVQLLGNYLVGIKDLQGAKLIKDMINDVYVIYIHCDDTLRKERAISRGNFDEIEWERRLQADEQDFNQDDIIKVANYFINNNSDLENFKEALDIVVSLIEQDRR